MQVSGVMDYMPFVQFHKLSPHSIDASQSKYTHAWTSQLWCDGAHINMYLGNADRFCRPTPKKEGWYLPDTLTKMSLPSWMRSTRIASSLQSCRINICHVNFYY